MRAFLAAALVLVTIAGCAAPSAPSLEGDAIVPGTWRVSGHVDHLLFWARNLGSAEATITWRLVQADGTAVPASWNLSFDPPTSTLAPAGTKRTEGGRTTYPDWQWSLATVTLPPDVPAGAQSLRLVLDGFERVVTMEVSAERGRVSAPGDRVTVQYAGRFGDNQQEFDSGSFATTLGSGETVPGFDYGLMGLAKNERLTLVVPPALAYGYDNPAGQFQRFNGRTLLFTVQLTDLGA
jgi:hypothetical protein